ncbi:sensor histidine kinase [Teichococcus vastitatis]|uniref:sensor histidine kinase n=1 Tax=Teichococcus vastitatis TaxID=2307076 RepID=UPI00240F5C86|nr:ATP-binding protein [Pseudoroseomonas vastitatis]
MSAHPGFLANDPPLVLAGLLLAFLAAGLAMQCWRLRRQLRTARAEAAAIAADLAARSRHLHLCAQEMHALGLKLVGQGEVAAGTDLPLDPPSSAAAAGPGRALLCLAADLQDMAARGTGPRILREERLMLEPLLRATLDQVAVAMAPGRREWRLAPELRGVAVLADRRALRGALAQVLTRAVRHTREGDPIELRLVRADDTFAILVEDEGAGLAAGDLGHALGGEGTRGIGLGLAVARQLLRAHGGDLTIEALRGVGARTWMTLPRFRLAEEPALSSGS